MVQNFYTSVHRTYIELANVQFRKQCFTTVHEVMLLAVATATSQPAKATSKSPLWSNGFVPPTDFPSPARICFGSHQADATHMYTGGYVMNLASNVIFEFSFPVAVKYRLIAVQLQKVAIDSDGVLTATLE